MINTKLQERVIERRNEFLDKVKNLGLNGSQLLNIKELATSMEQANINGEKELARTYKDLIKRNIIDYIKG